MNLPDEHLEHFRSLKAARKKKAFAWLWFQLRQLSLPRLIALRRSVCVRQAKKVYSLDREVIGWSDERENKKEENGKKGVGRALVGDCTRKSSRTEDGRIPMRAARLCKKYLPTACGQFMSSIVKLLLEKIPESGIESFKAELEIERNIRQQESIPNDRRKFSILFMYPASGQINIALIPYMFIKFICSWYGRPYDCNIMNRYGKEGPFAQSLEDDELGVVENSDDIYVPFQPAVVPTSEWEAWHGAEDKEEE